MSLFLSMQRCTVAVFALVLSCGAWAQPQTLNAGLMSHIPLSGFSGGPSNGSDCWGYTSPSGREYALMGLSNSLAVIEVTNPTAPVIVGQITHSNSLWADVKVYSHYCYVSNETGGGIDIINLSQVDDGIVTLVQRFTGSGVSSTHNVALNEDSGHLYLCGSNVGSGRLMAFSLANPQAPVFVGQVSSSQGSYCHDAQIVSYTSGPYSGKEIAFCCNGGSGFDIVDVTNKANMVRLSHSTYPNLSYCHQGWLSEDRRHFYLNDETDGVNETVIFNVEDLAKPQMVGSYNSGIGATDHNLYVKGNFIFEADYRGGGRIFCAADPTHPVQVGWFDTYPANDNSGYNGAWSVYPFFTGNKLVISDMESGFFLVDVTAALTVGTLHYHYPEGRPELVDPKGGTTVEVEVEGACGATAAPGTGLLYIDSGDGFQVIPMSDLGPNHYQATFPGAECGTPVIYFFSAQTTEGAIWTDPAGAPASTYRAVAAVGVTNLVEDNFEIDMGWTTENLGATSGFWERGVPVNDPDWQYDPESDGDGSGQCWLTQNQPGNTDVDNGAVRLTSPTFDLSSGNVGVSYLYFLRLTVADGFDRLLVEASNNGAAGPWVTIAVHDQDSSQGAIAHEQAIWVRHDITQSELVAAGLTLNDNMRFRFTANDSGTQSIVEAAIDGFTIKEYQCDPDCPAVDVNCDGLVNVGDLLAVINAWGSCPPPPAECAADINGDGQVDVSDLLMVINNWST